MAFSAIAAHRSPGEPVARGRGGIGLWFLSHLGAGYLKLVHATTRWQRIGEEHKAEALAPGTGFLTASWHGRIPVLAWLVPADRDCVAVISNARDGEIIARIVGRMGARAVRGSTFDTAKGRDKGGAQAYSGALEALERDRAIIGITPDGPRGPLMKAHKGAVQLSIQTGAPIMPVAYSVRWGRRLGSWDRFLLPFPFGKGVRICGPLLHPPAAHDEASVEQYRRELEATLTQLTQQADSHCGHEPLENVG